MRLSAQGDFGVPARTLADGRISTPAAFVKYLKIISLSFFFSSTFRTRIFTDKGR
jgi:hypothetical protein